MKCNNPKCEKNITKPMSSKIYKGKEYCHKCLNHLTRNDQTLNQCGLMIENSRKEYRANRRFE